MKISMKMGMDYDLNEKTFHYGVIVYVEKEYGNKKN